jgi:hypothetical protein
VRAEQAAGFRMVGGGAHGEADGRVLEEEIDQHQHGC